MVVLKISGTWTLTCTDLVWFQLSGTPRVRQQMYVHISFKNPFNMTLINASLEIEGAGLVQHTSFNYR